MHGSVRALHTNERRVHLNEIYLGFSGCQQYTASATVFAQETTVRTSDSCLGHQFLETTSVSSATLKSQQLCLVSPLAKLLLRWPCFCLGLSFGLPTRIITFAYVFVCFVACAVVLCCAPAFVPLFSLVHL